MKARVRNIRIGMMDKVLALAFILFLSFALRGESGKDDLSFHAEKSVQPVSWNVPMLFPYTELVLPGNVPMIYNIVPPTQFNTIFKESGSVNEPVKRSGGKTILLPDEFVLRQGSMRS